MTADRLIFYAVFITVFLTLSISGHVFIVRSLSRNMGISERGRKRLKYLLLTLGATSPLSFILYRMLPELAPFVSVLVTWIGFALLLTIILLICEAAFFLKFRSKQEVNLNRRLFLTRSTSAAAVFGAGGTGSFGVNVALSGPVVKNVEIALKKWPQSLSGFKIAQITDLHVGPSIHREYVEDVVSKINALDADLVVLTGDIVDGTIDLLREHVQPLKTLKSKNGVFMVTGNHEYYAGVVPWLDEFAAMGIRVLRNENLVIKNGDASFALVGVDDYAAKDVVPGHVYDLDRALQGRDPQLTTVLLAHQPRGFQKAVEKGVDFQISGHTHGGQIWPFGLFVSFVQPYVKGLHHVEESCIYVSCGTGFWGPAMRVNAPSEITLFNLKNV